LSTTFFQFLKKVFDRSFSWHFKLSTIAVSSQKKPRRVPATAVAGTNCDSSFFERISGAALHNSAREDCEENFRQNKAENRRNTLCISRFDNAVMAEICRKTPQMQLCGVALN
jgi:tRNA A37 threonylcarbamoyltransferase TsaD